MSHSIAISDDTYARLLGEARERETSPDIVADDILRRQLGAMPGIRRVELEALLARIRQRTADHAPGDIEADITEAAHEARELRRASHSRR